MFSGSAQTFKSELSRFCAAGAAAAKNGIEQRLVTASTVATIIDNTFFADFFIVLPYLFVMESISIIPTLPFHLHFALLPLAEAVYSLFFAMPEFE